MGSCPSGYYLNGLVCTPCKASCLACTGYSSCSSCVLDYTLTGSNCISNCGNGLRQGREGCDDGNTVSGDGCSGACQVEAGYICSPSSPSTTGPDVCWCDPALVQAEWTDNWGEILLNFASQLNYTSTTDVQSSDP